MHFITSPLLLPVGHVLRIWRIIYKFLMCVLWLLINFVISGGGWDPVNRFNHTSWMAVVGTQSLLKRIFVLSLDFFYFW